MPQGIATGAPAAPTFQQQFQEFMYYFGPIMQIIFWVALAVAAIWAVLLFRKFVALKAIEVGVDAVVAADAIDDAAAKADSKKADAKSADKDADSKVKVDEFVE